MNGTVRALGARKTIKDGSREVLGHDYGLQRVIAYSTEGTSSSFVEHALKPA